MRVALVEWYPRVCGSTEWGFHFARGAHRNLVIDPVTFTKSGKLLKDFYRPEFWTVHKQRDAVAVLNEYDLVVAIDLVCFAPKLSGRKFTQQEEFAPYYVEVLEKLRTPWTAMYHGGLYGSKYDVILRRLLASKKFAGKVFTTRLPQARAKLEPLASNRGIGYVNHPFLPFASDEMLAPSFGPKAKKSRDHSFLITSRIAVNKGQNVALGLLDRLEGNVHVWGYNAFGLPSIGWRLWELGNALGYRVARPVELRRDCRDLTHPRAARFYTGRFAFARGRVRYDYHDGYDRHDDVDWSPWLHLSLTSTDFEGSLEYVTLNAIAAGCVAVVPEHSLSCTRGRYGDAVVTVPFERCTWWAATEDKEGTPPRDVGRKGKFIGDEVKVVEVLNAWRNASDSTLQHQLVAQRRKLIELHDPVKVVRKLIGGL